MGSTLERGTLLHKRYRIVEILGQGGMGSVYRAVDENLGVDVAVKENLFASDEYARQFRLEAVLLANLRHPHLPRVTDHFVIDNQGQYLIMDYIEGEDLRQRMERAGSISEQEALLIGVAMCDALEYLHTRKPSVIHRDVKPGNVRIAPDGHIYLVDFGLAKLVKGSQATTTGARAMTPGYSPPEQYGTARTDPRTDVYSLGATLYAALTGVIPEDGLARAMDNVELTPLRKRNPAITRKLAAAIEKAMAVHPEDRYQSAEEFKQALVTTNVKTQKLDGEIFLPPETPAEERAEEPRLDRELVPPSGEPPVDEPPPFQPPRPRRHGAGSWAVFSFSLLAVLAAVTSVAYFWTPISAKMLSWLVTSTPTRVVARVSPSPVSVDPVALDLTATSTRSATKPALKTTPPASTRTPTITRTPTQPLLPTLTPTWTPTVSPAPTLLAGGYSQLAFASMMNGVPQIFLATLGDTKKISLQQLTNVREGACQPDWSPDGEYLVFISPCADHRNEYPGAKMFVINADGSGLMDLPSSDAGDFDPAWSPDGDYIAFTSLRDGLAQIYVMKLPEYSVTQLTRKSADKNLPDWSRQPAWSPDGNQIVYTGHGRLTDAPQIWVMSSEGQDQHQFISRGPTYWDGSPDWSPDGKTVLFNETNGAQALGWLMVFDTATAQAAHLRAGMFANHGRYSPDGLWAAYESINVVNTSDTDYDVYFMKNENGNSPIKILTDSAVNFDPAWRPK